MGRKWVSRGDQPVVWLLSGLKRWFDPSASRQATETRSESDERYRHLIEASPTPINLFDADGDIVWGNDALLELLELESRADLVGRSIFEFVDPDDRYTAEQELLAVVDDKQTMGPTSMRLSPPGAAPKQIRVSTAPGRYDGRDIGQAVIIDVTPLNSVRSDLEREREFVENALDAIQDVFYVVDTDGTLLRWNDVLEERLGYPDADIETMELEEFFVDEHVDRVSESIQTAFRDGEAVVTATVVTEGGMEVPYEFRKRTLEIDGEVVGLVGIGRDVSEQRARDQHLRAVDRLLQHALRNRLNVVQGSTQLLREDVGDDSVRFVDRIETSVDRLLSIFDDHRYIVELFSSDTEVRTFDVVPVVERAIAKGRASHPSATIELSAPDTAPVSAVAMLERAVVELIDNAVTHNDRSDVVVEVDVEVDDPLVYLRVADNGPPIPSMERNVVTEAQPTTSTYHSEGLGLWFVHWVMERSSGSLSFGDREPRGNEVTMTVRTPRTVWD